MSRNEIRLRRHRMTATGADRFRNYNDVLQRHERERKIRRMIRAFIMFVLILALIGLIFFLSRIEEGDVQIDSKSPASSNHSTPSKKGPSAKC